MAVDKAMVVHVANLANLELTEAEVSYYQTQLSKVLEHIAQLSDMPDTLGKDWRSDTLGNSTPERADEAKPSLAPERALAEAPRKIGTAFQVPRIIE